MSKFTRILVLVVIEIILLPITIIGIILFMIDFVVSVLGKKMALTTYDPMFARWTWELLGKRDDRAIRQLAFAIPGIHRVPVTLAFGPTLLATRLSGYFLGCMTIRLSSLITL